MEQLLLWIETYGTPAILLLIALEYACFPISSELVLPFAGAIGAGCGISLPLLVLYSSLAGLVGTSLTYGIGRYGGSPMMEKLMTRFPSTKKPILSSYRTFGNHGKSAVFQFRDIFFFYFNKYKMIILFAGLLLIILLIVTRQNEQEETV